MNANNYFNNQNEPPTPRGFVNDNQWAASFGGPIKKDKTFFFVNTEGLYLIVPVSRSVNVPTAAFETGHARAHRINAAQASRRCTRACSTFTTTLPAQVRRETFCRTAAARLRGTLGFRRRKPMRAAL